MSSLSPASDALEWGSTTEPARPQRTWQSYLAIASMIIPALALLVVGIIAGRPPADGEIESGITVGSVELTETRWSDARVDLEAAFDAYLSEPIQISLGGKSADVTPAELGISFDLDATGEEVLDVGRGGLFSGTGERVIAHTSGYDIEPVVDVDEAAYLSVVASLADGVVRPPVNAVFRIDRDTISVSESRAGIGIDPANALQRLVTTASEMATSPIELDTTVVEPNVSSSELEGVLDEATLLRDSSLRVSDGSEAWAYGPNDILAFLTYEDGEIAVDRLAVSASLGALAGSIEQLATSAEIVREEGGAFSITEETLDRRLDVNASADAVAAAILAGEQEVDLVVVEREPLLSKARLLPLYRELTEMVTRGVTLSWFEGALPLDKQAFSDSIYWNVNTGDIWFDHEALAAAIQPVADAATRPPTNPRWIGGKVVAGTDSRPAVRGEAYASLPNVINAAMSGHKYAELVVVEDVSADLNAEALGIQINHVLGTSVTYYGDSNENRRTNVEVAARALNGAMVPPHSMFSFNEAIGGTATLDDGYQMGYGIIAKGGEILTVPSVAGGICQVATAAFQASFWAGMPIETRTWHMYWIPRYGTGQGTLTGLDATVDPDFGLDYEFYNPTDNWLAISAWADGEYLTVEVWGVNQGWSVEVDDPLIYNRVEADHEIIRRFDPSVEPGREVRVENAQDGFSVSIHRVVRDAEGNVLLDATFDSYYLPARNLVLVGPA